MTWGKTIRGVAYGNYVKARNSEAPNPPRPEAAV